MYTLIIESVLLVAYIYYVIHSYAANNVSYFVRGLTLISWLVSFSLIIILPYDLYDTLRPENEQQRQNIRITWTTMYWVSFVLTWYLNIL